MVNLEDHRDEATIVHWHGQKPPADQDGVGQFGIPLLQPGERRAYDFAARPGTYWMHSHQGFQHQKMLSAPLIVRTTDDVRADAEEVTIFRSEEHTSELQSLMRISYDVFCLKKKNNTIQT